MVVLKSKTKTSLIVKAKIKKLVFKLLEIGVFILFLNLSVLL